MTRRLLRVFWQALALAGLLAQSPVGAQSSAGTVLFITGSSPLTAGTGDWAIKDHLEHLSPPYAVIVEPTTGTVLPGDATGKDVVLISSTALASKFTGTGFRDLTVPIVAWQGAASGVSLFDNTHLALATSIGTSPLFSEVVMKTFPGTPYSPPQWQGASNTLHPGYLSAGFSQAGDAAGIVPVTTSLQTLSWGVATPTAFVVATLGTDTQLGSHSAVFAYDKNVTLSSNTAAKARRVGLFMTNNTAASFTTNGWKLFDAAVTWSKAQNGAPVFSPPTSTLQNVHLNPATEGTALGQSTTFDLDRFITAPVLQDVVSDDGAPFPSTQQWTWTQVSGPSLGSITNATFPVNASTVPPTVPLHATVNVPWPNPGNSTATYQFALTVSDGDLSSQRTATLT